MTLTSMTAFVLQQSENYPQSSRSFDKAIEILETVESYAKFLSRPLELWMFVPCKFENGKWVVLEKPKDYDLWAKYGDFTQHGKSLTNKCIEYHKAQERVLFEGFETEFHPNRIYFDLSKHNNIVYFIRANEFSSPSKRLLVVEDLLLYSDLILTPTAIKEIQI